MKPKRSIHCGVVLVLLALILLWNLLPKASADGNTSKPVDFNRDIRPILSDNCFACHGPDEKQRMARLRFDTREGAFEKPGVIIAGDAAQSKLIQRVTAKDPYKLMPPAYSGHKLSDKQIDLLRRWVEEGAKWETHWAYLAPQRTEPPQVNTPLWPRNPIDNFILARLEREGLKPSPEADKATLLRRLTFDLTGLPPTLAELDSFLADPSPQAYEKRVDKLLQSPRYGERMAMPWLDQARYADTHGYHIDSQRDMWIWRDWLINAFNQNKPFDQFTIEQLAGDLLPNATLDQKIASGFNRNHMINFEGGAIPDEYLVEYVVDRVETTANNWMGMTMGCARCHSHKYDPITHKEFYQFFAFFNTVKEKGLDGNTGNAAPVLPMPTEQQKVKVDALTAAIKNLEEALAAKEVSSAQEDWEKPFVGKIALAANQGLVAHFELDGSFSDISGSYRHGRTVKGDPTFGNGQLGRSVSFDGDSQVSFGNLGDFDSNEPFTLAMWVNGYSNQPVAILQKIDNAASRRGIEFWFEDARLAGIQRYAGHMTIRLTSSFPDKGIQVRTRERLALGSWHHLALNYDGSGKASGVKLYINGKPRDIEIQKDTLEGSMKNEAELQVGNGEWGKQFRGALDDLRLYNRQLNAAEIEQLAIHYPIQAILYGVFGKRTKDLNSRVRDYFLTYAANEKFRKQFSELKNLKQQKDELDKQIVSVMVMGEMEKPRETFILGRGDYRNKTEKVMAGVPAVLPPIPNDAPPNRLSLARWLVDPRHPLTARVAVNRYWQMYFGTGIVKTSEDFGSQGEPPVHPQLLDWLATEFMRTGWDVKAMQRLIVTSATYRQSSKTNAELIEKDPENRLLARGARFRMPAEMIRDNALAASGLLNDAIGGASVYPYQPKGLWEEMAFGDGFSAQEYRQSSGKDLYRRSLYTFWKRTVPPPSLVTFDAPDREKCTGRRALTNTPLQALVLMNDPTYVEAARVLAQRALREGGKDIVGRIAFAFRLATARKPSANETRVLRDLLQQQLANYRSDKNAAAALLKVGDSAYDKQIEATELAAWTMVASAILNLDEAIIKE